MSDVDVRADGREPVRRRAVVLGATNPIGRFLLPRLVAAGYGVTAVARREAEMPAGATLERVDLRDPGTWEAPAGDAAISLLPLAVLVGALPRFREVRCLVAIGSTSLFSKAGSDDPVERATARKLERAEDALSHWASQHRVPVTVLRPTLVYDGRDDRNIARMIRVVRRTGVLPIARPSSGLRQPIHADDVARAVMGALDNPAAWGRAFNIAGGEVLTYRAMAERVFASQGLKARFLVLPVPLLRAAFGLASRLGVLRESAFGSAVFARMNQDLVFDTAEGLGVLGYAPRAFAPPSAGGQDAVTPSS